MLRRAKRFLPVVSVLAAFGLAAGFNGIGHGAENKKTAQKRSSSPQQVHPATIYEQVSPEEFPGWMQRHLNGLQWNTRQNKNKLDRQTLQQSFKLGRQFMLNNQKPAGNFNYQYDFVAKQMDQDDNQVRQAGALWGLALMFQHDQDPSNKAALDKGLRFFFDCTKAGPVTGSLLIAYPGVPTCRTGTVALVALSIIEYLRTAQAQKAVIEDTYRKELLGYLKGYLAHLTYMRLENKHFSSSYSLRTKSKSTRFSPYFDGETMLCLIKAAKYLGHTELIPLIEDSAMTLARDYTIQEWHKDPDSRQTKGFFQWSCMAFWEYEDAGWKNADTFGDYVLSLAWWMIYTHHTLKRTRNTSYAYEGIIYAYRLAQKRNHKAALYDLAYTIDRGLFKLTSWQVGGPLQSFNKFLTTHPTQDPLAVGGIMNHRREAPLRIDVTQHQMHAVILALKHVYTAQ